MTIFENSPSRQNHSSHTKFNSAYFVRPAQSGSFLIHVSNNQKQKFLRVDMRQLLHHLPIIKENSNTVMFSISGIYGKSLSQSLNFVFLRSCLWYFTFYILWFHFRLRFFHISSYWSRSSTECIADQYGIQLLFINFCQGYSSI